MDWNLNHILGEGLTGQILGILIVLVLAFIANLIARRLILHGLRIIISYSRNTWDDIFLKRHVFDRLSHLAPALVIYATVSFTFPQNPTIQEWLERLCLAYMALVSCRVVDAFLNAVVEIYQKFSIAQSYPIRTYTQVVKIVVYLITGIFVVSILIDKSPMALLTGLGAMTAIILLVFKDTIAGFVASIQLTTNNMIQRGDWIEMPKFGADGDVIDVSIHTVKVQNWDKTITTIPTYALVHDAFKNWRGMSESEGRRIKRTVSIDMNSVKFCDSQMLERFGKIEFLKDYLNEKEKELQAHNASSNHDPSHQVNGRHQTNLGVFRAYLQQYLKRHPMIHQNMTLLVRHLQPNPTGLPIELYIFSTDQDWIAYEAIQADIFDHILAVIPEFDLRVFQYPSGKDLFQRMPS